MSGPGWSVRVRAAKDNLAAATLRGQTVTVGPPLAFDPQSKIPSALEMALCAYGCDLLNGFVALAKRERIAVFDAEIAVTGELNNPLMHVGVIGEEGDPGIEALSATLYVTSDAEEAALNELWQTTLTRSPLHVTLSRCAKTDARLVIQ